MRGRRVLPVRMSLEDVTEGRIWGKGLRRRIKREKKKEKKLRSGGQVGCGRPSPNKVCGEDLTTSSTLPGVVPYLVHRNIALH